MTAAPDLTTMTTATAATTQTRTAAAPQIKLLPHPDLELGEQLIANAQGVTGRGAMEGILRQLTMRKGSSDRVASYKINAHQGGAMSCERADLHQIAMQS